MSLLFPKDRIHFNLLDADLSYYPNFFDNQKSKELFQKLETETPWQHDSITVYGKKYMQPRLTALFGNEGKPYKYSSILMHPNSWSPVLQTIKEKVEKICKVQFTSVLLNYYRDGKDSNGWHADNEPELGQNPIIASISFGSERYFHLKHNTNKEMKLKIKLEEGSLLVMKGTTQHFWKHQIPKVTTAVGPRINLTFRVIKSG